MTKAIQALGIAAGLALSTLAFSPASAQGAGCGCVQPLPVKGSPVGMISDANKDVLMSGRNGMKRPQANAPLTLGSRVIVGPAGQGSMTVGGTCNLALAPNTTVDVGQANGQVCVRTAQVGKQSDIVLMQNSRETSAPPPPPSDDSNLGLGLAAVGAGTGAAIIAFQGDGGKGNNDPISLGD